MSSALDPELIAVLACPCPRHAPVAETDHPAGLQCQRCRTQFPIRDGIPVMLLSEATPGPNGIGEEA